MARLVSSSTLFLLYMAANCCESRAYSSGSDVQQQHSAAAATMQASQGNVKLVLLEGSCRQVLHASLV